MVFMEWGHFQSANVHPPTEQMAGRMGSNQYRSKMPSTATSPSSNTTQNTGINDGGLVTKMETLNNKPQPTTNQRIPAEMDYLRHFAMDTAYIPTQQELESHAKYKSRIYATVVLLLREMTTLPAMRVIWLWPPRLELGMDQSP
jgi:hypothetical protein